MFGGGLGGVLNGMKIVQVCFLEYLCDSIGTLLLGIIVCIDTDKHGFMLFSPDLNLMNKIVKKLSARVWGCFSLLMKNAELLVIRVVGAKVYCLVLADLIAREDYIMLIIFPLDFDK